MGLKEKLNLLLQSKNALQTVLSQYFGSNSDTTLFRNYANLCKKFTYTPYRVWEPTSFQVRFFDELSDNAYHTHVLYHSSSSLYPTYCPPAACSGTTALVDGLGAVPYDDYLCFDTLRQVPNQTYKDTITLGKVPNGSFSFNARHLYTGIYRTINMPSKYSLTSTMTFCPLYNFSVPSVQEYIEQHFLTRGLIWRECTYCSTSWLTCNLTAERKVVCTKPITVNTYFNMIPMSAETIVGIISALKPLSSGTNTLCIGEANKNKLTTAQLEVAYQKGWTIT